MAEYDDGSEFDVTSSCDWSVDPEDYASINQVGHLTAGEVLENQSVVVQAVFTWQDETETANVGVTIVDVAQDSGPDPWPEYQRTPSRIGRTSSIGPRTPRIAWTLLVDSSDVYQALPCSPVMDAAGRLYLGVRNKVVCLDTHIPQILWEFVAGSNVLYPPSIWYDRLLFGSSDDFFYCLSRETGQEIWSVPAAPHPNRGQVVGESPAGPVVFFPSQADLLYARLVTDGAEVWTVPTGDHPETPPSLDGFGLVFLGTTGGEVVVAHNTDDGSMLWAGPPGENSGVTPVVDSHVFGANFNYPGPLYCLDAETGDEIWSFSGVGNTNSAIAIGHDGTVYIAENSSQGRLFAISSAGEELWSYSVNSAAKLPPIVDGEGKIYLSSRLFDPPEGFVHAFSPDGTPLWVKEFPDETEASPMLSPDGTLYILCKDKFLYAIRDPAKGDVSLNDIIDGRDIRFFIRVLFGVDDDEIRFFAADMNSDGVVDTDDVPLFVDTLLTVQN